jgi:hypothetical protein
MGNDFEFVELELVQCIDDMGPRRKECGQHGKR